MSKKSAFNWQDGLKIVLAVMAFGIGWFADNQATVIAFLSMLIVWFVSVVAKNTEKFPWLAWFKGKGPLTGMIFVMSFVCAYLFRPFSIPMLPGWTGDFGTYVPLFSGWVSAFFAIIGNAVTFSMSVYNLILAGVLEKIPDVFSGMFRK